MSNDRLLGALAEARALGFLGPGPLEAHVASAAAFAEAIGDVHGPALDLGSGGGVPGLLLADRFDATPWVLVDQHRRRTSFLARTVSTLGWVGRVIVIRHAAEVLAHDPAHRRRYELVVARSFGPPAVTAEIATGFLGAGGRLLVAEPPDQDPDRWPLDGLTRLGLTRAGDAGPIATFVAAERIDDGLPRSWRELQRRPAWHVSRETSSDP